MKDKPAFPTSTYDHVDGNHYEHRIMSGMTLRQWYKGMALSGILARGDWDPAQPLERGAIALLSSEIADALIEEDEQHEKKG